MKCWNLRAETICRFSFSTEHFSSNWTSNQFSSRARSLILSEICVIFFNTLWNSLKFFFQKAVQAQLIDIDLLLITVKRVQATRNFVRFSSSTHTASWIINRVHSLAELNLRSDLEIMTCHVASSLKRILNGVKCAISRSLINEISFSMDIFHESFALWEQKCYIKEMFKFPLVSRAKLGPASRVQGFI